MKTLFPAQLSREKNIKVRSLKVAKEEKLFCYNKGNVGLKQTWRRPEERFKQGSNDLQVQLASFQV